MCHQVGMQPCSWKETLISQPGCQEGKPPLHVIPAHSYTCADTICDNAGHSHELHDLQHRSAPCEPHLQAIINFDAPKKLETYLHRIGRTARAGASGQSVTFVEDCDRALLKDVVKRAHANMLARQVPQQVRVCVLRCTFVRVFLLCEMTGRYVSDGVGVSADVFVCSRNRAIIICHPHLVGWDLCRSH